MTFIVLGKANRKDDVNIVDFEMFVSLISLIQRRIEKKTAPLEILCSLIPFV